jgi:hypothetical protein
MITKTTSLLILCILGVGLSSFKLNAHYESSSTICYNQNSEFYTYTMTYHQTISKEVEDNVKAFLLSRKGINSCEVNSLNKTISIQTEREMVKSDVDHLFHMVEHKFLEQ